MFIHTSLDSDGTAYITMTAEENGSSSGSTVTHRLSLEEANYLCRQLDHDIQDWHVEHHDSHERADLRDEYHEERAEIELDLAFADEPF